MTRAATPPFKIENGAQPYLYDILQNFMQAFGIEKIRCCGLVNIDWEKGRFIIQDLDVYMRGGVLDLREVNNDDDDACGPCVYNSELEASFFQKKHCREKNIVLMRYHPIMWGTPPVVASTILNHIMNGGDINNTKNIARMKDYLENAVALSEI